MSPPAPPSLPPDEQDFWPAFGKSFANVAVAEVFDKTWFVALFLGTTCGSFVTFVGAYSALSTHVFLAAGMGLAISAIPYVCPAIWDFATAGVLLIFALVYAYDAWNARADDDMIAEGNEEYNEHFGKPDGEATASGSSCCSWSCVRRTLSIALTVFIAEWGDRTQFVMIALHTSLPLFPVLLGSLGAFALLVGSAVLLASLVARLRLDKRLVTITISVSFAVFAILSAVEGVSKLSDCAGNATHAGTNSSRS